MIVPLKEATIVSAHGDQAATLAALQDLGVLHLASAPAGPDDGVAVMRARLATVRHAADVLAHAAPDAAREAAERDAPTTAAGAPSRPAEDVVAEVERLAEGLDDLRTTRSELVRTHARLAPFGRFDPASVRALESHGLTVRLARPPLARALPEAEGAAWIELGRDRRRRAMALVGPTAVVDATAVPHEVALPSSPSERLAGAIDDVDRAVERARDRLAALVADRGAVDDLLHRTEEALRYEEARAGMARVGAVEVLRGFVPAEHVPRLEALAAERGWGLWVEDVRDPNEAPTLIRNPAWVRPIAPLFSFLGVVPAYGHVDISVAFLVFFSLFFAMIVGDAGYGLLFLGLTELGARRYRAAPRRVIALMRLLSVSTVAWGLASGNVFGLAALPPVLGVFRLDWLTQERNVIALAFTIGAVHLTLAHVWNAVRFVNTTRALAELGWVATTWTMYLLARQLVLGDPFPAWAWTTFGMGVVLIVLFTTPWRRLRGAWFQHAMLPLNLVSNFVDVVSYVRLFAVGAATFAVATAFNDLAASVGLGGPLGGVLSALVLFFGHSLNVALAAMGVLVHGVRLNTLEFAGHLGLPWTGHPYRPFARWRTSDAVTAAGASAARAAEGDPAWTPR
jgi:V/A-type H+/Na+-transporting ATPase subunit I